MSVWQSVTGKRFRVDDKYTSGQQLDIRAANDGSIMRLEIINARCDDGHQVEAVIGVGVLELLAALQGAGVTREEVAGVWGLGATGHVIDHPRAVRDNPQA